MITQALLDEDFAESEVGKYLGIGGQAIFYKVGERAWMNAREDARKRIGDRFSLKKFHALAFQLGTMALELFEDESPKWDGNKIVWCALN